MSVQPPSNLKLSSSTPHSPTEVKSETKETKKQIHSSISKEEQEAALEAIKNASEGWEKLAANLWGIDLQDENRVYVSYSSYTQKWKILTPSISPECQQNIEKFFSWATPKGSRRLIAIFDKAGQFEEENFYKPDLLTELLAKYS